MKIKNQLRKAKQHLRLCAFVENIDERKTYLEIEYRHQSGGRRRMLVERKYLANPHKIYEMVLDLGGRLPTGHGVATRLIREALSAPAPETYRTRSLTGWHEQAFWLPDQIISKGRVKMRYLKLDVEATDNPQLVRGTKEAWQRGLHDACTASSYLTFTISAGFAGTLLRPAQQDEGCTFYFFGESSTGKTLAELAAMSVIGPAVRSRLLTHDMTPRALEERAAAANDLTGAIDEVARKGGSVMARRAGLTEMSHILASGQGRIRSSKAVRDSSLRNVSFLGIFLSSGETSVGDGRQRGEEVRWIEIPVPPMSPGGVFDRRSDSGCSPRELAKQSEDTIAHNHGHAIREFLTRFTDRYDTNAVRARKLIYRFVKKVRAQDNPWDQRFAAKFGVVYAAAVLAVDFGIAPWTRAHALSCIRRVYFRARRQVHTVDEAAQDLMRRLKRAAHSRRHFPLVLKGTKFPRRAAQRAWGVRRRSGNGNEFLAVPRRRFDSIVRPSRHAAPVLRLLNAKKIVMRGKAGRMVRQVQVSGFDQVDRPHFVCISLNRLAKEIW